MSKQYLLRCKACKGECTYPIKQFNRAHTANYIKYGYVNQYCSCKDTNQAHILVGYYEEITTYIDVELN